MTTGPAPYYQDELVRLYLGDCLEVLPTLPDNSVDAVATDPPYSISFMGREWDSHPTPAEFQLWCMRWSAECLRILKPGGHLLAFGGTRTSHRLACAVEDAGFEIRDSIAWLYGSGFPKSLDVSKAIDRAAGAEREVVATKRGPGSAFLPGNHDGTGATADAWRESREPYMPLDITAPATPEAARWQGWGTAMKPAFEPIVVARKPLTGTVAANVLRWGTGALNIDAGRIGTEGGTSGTFDGAQSSGVFAANDGRVGGTPAGGVIDLGKGRWPANVALDESQAAALDQMSGELTSGANATRRQEHRTDAMSGTLGMLGREETTYGDTGGASRFFYTSKASSDERITHNGVAHPTVKPLSLARWLVRLVTPPGGVILEPFAGSGTTVEAALLEGFRCIAIEREADYLPLITQRINRRRDPIAYLTAAGDDLGLFGGVA